MPVSLKTLLKNQIIAASAPCRIDAGGTWDIKSMALPLNGISPTTVNFALSLRTHVDLLPYQDDWVKISSKGFSRHETFHKDRTPFNSAFGLFFAAISYFGFHGVEVRINSQSPDRSALGGSSTALVALIKALAKAAVLLGEKGLSRKTILHLGYHLEDGVSGGNCGLQDQAAAVYGGANQWIWHYDRRTGPFDRVPLLDQKGCKTLSKHLLIAFSGKRHVATQTNRNWIKDFLSGRTRAEWRKLNDIVHDFALAIKEQDWHQASRLLRKEMTLRKKITPEALIPVTTKLIRQAEHAGCGARFAGAGAGGSLWALGRQEDIQGLGKTWQNTLATVKDAVVLKCRVDWAGVR